MILNESNWRTGYDPETIQLVPHNTRNPFVRSGSSEFLHVRFKVKQYGEVSMAIHSGSIDGEEAKDYDLSNKTSLKIVYKANHELVLQLRQTGVHGGVHNHVKLPATGGFTTINIPFDEFAGGKAPLDLAHVAKFNFAFLENNPQDGFAELYVKAFQLQ
jgi:hypothetical protein